MILAGVGIAVVCCCCISSALAYGNINIFSSSGGISTSDLAYAKGFGGAPDSSSSLLSQYGSSDCVLGPWGSWSPCSPKCGAGQMTRTRPIAQPPTGNGTCIFPTTETQTCTGTPACQVDQIAGQYLPCTDGSTITGASCIVAGTHPSEDECESLKNQAISASTTGQGGVIAGAASGGVGLAINAAIVAGNFDCSTFYYCPDGFRDTHVNQKCDKDAVPKCPEAYNWDNTAKRCQFINP